MKLKARIFSAITTFVLLVCMLIVGVWALKQLEFSVSGSFNFKAAGIDATISCTGLENGTLTEGTLGIDKLTDITINTSMTKTDLLKTFSPWQSLKLAFDEEGNDILLKLRITNDAKSGEDNYIYSKISVDEGISSNCTISALNDVDNTSVAIISPTEYADFTIKFSVTNKKNDASLTDFGLNVNLQMSKYEDLIFPLTYYADTLTFTCDESTQTASVKAANTSITTVDIPSNVRSSSGVVCAVDKISSNAFTNCTNLTNILIPNSVNNIEIGAFYGCSELKTITIPNSVTTLGDGIVANCNKLTTIVVENGNSVFDSRDNCNAIINTNTNTLVQGCQNTAIPSNVTGIGTYAFYYCESLTNAIIPDSVLSIEDYAFEGCSSLTSVTIGNSVTSIGENAFCGSGLTSLKIPENVTSVGRSAFQSCYELNSVTIGKSVTSIESDAFSDCRELSEINYLGDIDSWASISFGNLSANPTYYTQTLKIKGEVVTSIIIDTANKINNNAFVFCKSLTSVIMGDSVTSIGYNAFYGCSGLTSLTIGENVTTIGSGAFFECSSLTSLKIPENVTSVGRSAFSSCDDLTKIFIDRASIAMKLLGTDYSYCGGILSNSDIQYIYIKTSIVEEGNVPYYILNNYLGVLEITSDNAVSEGESDNIGYTRFSKVFSINDYNGILVFTCNETTKTASVKAANTSITSADIPAYVKTANNVVCKVNTIEEYAFSSCANLTSVTIPTTVTSIGAYAFYLCANLQSITIPSGVTTIGDRTFQGCTNLKTANLPNTITSFGNYAFRSCTYLENLSLPSSLKTMGDFALSGCKSLTSLVVPNSVTTIGDYAFEYCFGMTKITIGSGVTSIAEHAFAETYRLVEVYNLSTVNITTTSFGLDSVDNYDVRIYSSGTSNISKDANGFVFNKIDGTYYLIAYEGKETNITLPSSYNGSNYVMRRYALYNYEFLNNVTIPSNLTSIGAYAMAHCYGLTSLVIPSNIQTIGDYAFWKSTAITTITIGSGVTSIGTSAFEGCDSRENIFIDSSSIASQLSGTDLSICGGLLNNFDYLYINNSILSSLNSYVENNYTEEDDLLVTDEHVSGYTYYFTATTVTPAPFEPTDPDPGTSFA